MTNYYDQQMLKSDLTPEMRARVLARIVGEAVAAAVQDAQDTNLLQTDDRQPGATARDSQSASIST